MAKSKRKSTAVSTERRAVAMPAGTPTEVETVDPLTGEVRKEQVINDLLLLKEAPTLVKRVTLTVLRVPDHSVILFKALSEIVTGKVLQKDRKPAEIMRIETIRGEEKLLVCGTIVEKELKGNYPNDSYVGKWFVLKKYPRAIDAKGKAKDYNTYDIAEISPPIIDLEPQKVAAQ